MPHTRYATGELPEVGDRVELRDPHANQDGRRVRVVRSVDEDAQAGWPRRSIVVELPDGTVVRSFPTSYRLIRRAVTIDELRRAQPGADVVELFERERYGSGELTPAEALELEAHGPAAIVSNDPTELEHALRPIADVLREVRELVVDGHIAAALELVDRELGRRQS